MSDDDVMRMVRRNKLVGLWAAEKLGLVGEGAKAYSDDLAMGALDPTRANLLTQIREDFRAAGVVQSDEQIIGVMNQSWLGAQSEGGISRADPSDAAVVQFARNFQAKADRF